MKRYKLKDLKQDLTHNALRKPYIPMSEQQKFTLKKRDLGFVGYLALPLPSSLTYLTVKYFTNTVRNPSEPALTQEFWETMTLFAIDIGKVVGYAHLYQQFMT